MAQTVTVVSCPDYSQEVCRKALEEALAPIGLSWVRPGMRIGIKANLVAAMEPNTAATTHPALLAALTAMLRQRGAEVVVGDSPGGLYNAPTLEKVYRVCGLSAVEAAGGTLNQDFSQKEAHFPQGAVLHHFHYTAWLDQCDAIINFCKLKTHGMLAMTGAVKNFFGTIPGTMKPEYHFRFPDPMDFASMLVDLQEYWKPKLHLVDAVVAMEGNGPTAGTPKPMGLLLASEDPYALDRICAPLMGLPANRVLTNRAALERGLAEETPFPEHLQPNVKDFRLPPAKSTLFRSILPGKAGEYLGKAIQSILSPRPKLTAELCIGCGKCARICPPKAITMKNQRPKINRSKCITCFCCQEFCPKGALEAKRTLPARILNRQ